jgi:hypothetical protein
MYSYVHFFFIFCTAYNFRLLLPRKMVQQFSILLNGLYSRTSGAKTPSKGVFSFPTQRPSYFHGESKANLCCCVLFRLTSMEKMKKCLDRGGDCVAFICKCCPPSYLKGGEQGRSARRIGMSVFWLETIATKLGTFLPLSEREFLVEALYDKDPDGENHVRWLSALLVSLGEGPAEESKLQLGEKE